LDGGILDVLVLAENRERGRTSVESSQQTICSFVPSKHILIQDILPTFLFHFILPENEILMIVFLVVKIFLEIFRVAHVRSRSRLYDITLVVCIFFVALLDYFSRSTEAVEGEEMVDNVIVKPIFVEEDVVFLVTC
jgi:hypothetical protein